MNVHCPEPLDKIRYFKAFSENSINMGGPGHVRGEMYAKILDRLHGLSRGVIAFTTSRAANCQAVDVVRQDC